MRIGPLHLAAGLTGLFLLAVAVSLVTGPGGLQAGRQDERRIALYNIHTKDTLDIVYMRQGRRLPEAMKQINWFLRDWRQNEPTRMDPELIDLLWEIRTELGTQEPTHVISGYRSPKTNEMLRKTKGGQARKSKHMLGQAMDIHFPDVPVKRLRYSALIRERGGVGYYPTSAIPFVHIDTGRTRHWPRMPRYELALLFPNGKTRHVPSDGRRITRADVKTARARHRDLAVQVASFHEFRRAPQAPKPMLVASGWGASVRPDPVAPSKAAPPRLAQSGTPARSPLHQGQPAPVTAPQAEYKVASLGELVPPSPRLVPREAMRPRSPVTSAEPQMTAQQRPPSPAQPTSADRMQLASLFALASLGGSAKPPKAPLTASSGADSSATDRGASPSLPSEARLGVSGAGTRPRLPADALSETDMTGWSNGFVAAPAFDEEHPEELHYRPFPLAPLLTSSASADDPVLAHMQHPDVTATLELMDEQIVELPMRFTQSHRIAELLWSQQFTGKAINPGSLRAVQQPQGTSGALASRSVRTSSR